MNGSMLGFVLLETRLTVNDGDLKEVGMLVSEGKSLICKAVLAKAGDGLKGFEPINLHGNPWQL